MGIPKTCGAHGCLFGKHEGQGTNGGCDCLAGTSTANRLRVEQHIYKQTQTITKYDELVRKLEGMLAYDTHDIKERLDKGPETLMLIKQFRTEFNKG